MDGDKTIISAKKVIRGSYKTALVVFAFLLMVTFTFWGTQSFSKSVYTASLEISIYNSSDLINNQETVITENETPVVADDPVPMKYEFDAKSAISVQIGPDSQEILFSKNETEKLPVASLTKLMTALIVLEKYDLSQKITISESAMSQIGEQGNLKAGEVLSVKDLLYITLIESSNRSAKALAELVGTDKFTDLMNEKAKNLNLLNTHFEDSTGLDPKSYSTVNDLAKLSEYLFFNYPLFGEIISLKEFDLYSENGTFHHKLINTNKLLGEIPGIIGGKTGWTDEAQGCFMIIQRDSKSGSYIVHIILGSEDRFSAMKELINKINLSL